MFKKNRAIFPGNLLILLGFVIFLNLFFFNFWGSVAFALFLLGFFIFLMVLLWKNKLLEKNKRLAVIISISLIIISLLVLTRANVFMSVIVYLFALAITVLFATIVKDRIPFVRSLFELLIIPFNFALSYLESGLDFLISLFPNKSKEKTTPSPTGFLRKLNLLSITVGLLIGLPVVVILLGLFSSADPIYATFLKNISEYLSKIFKGIIWQRLGDRLILSLITTVVFAPFIYFFGKKKSFTLPKIVASLSFIKEASIVMFLVALTLGSFIIVQWPYIFVRVPFETDLSKFGIATYSEYVKKGFAELLMVSLIVYSLIWVSFLALRGKTTAKRLPLFFLQMIVLGEFFLILFSIARRVYLYQAYHGWSLGRIYGSFFLLWLFLITVTLLLRHFRKDKWVLFEVIATAAVVLVLGFFNAEEFIVKIHPPTVNKQIDYVYLSRMSADGYLGWLKAFGYAKDVLVNRQLENKTLIGKDERREVVYAGMIVNNLSGDYHNLISRFANSTELKDYYQQIFTNELAKTDFCSSDLRKTQASSQATDTKISLFYWHRSLISFAENSCVNVAFYDFTANKQKTAESLSAFNKFLQWNYANAQAYKRMKKEMNIKDLLILQNQFTKLFQKIASQPENERDFEIDISFRSPFL